MAYKIQVGDARLSGSLTQEGVLDTADGGGLKGSQISSSTSTIIHGDSAGEGAIGLGAEKGLSLEAESEVIFSNAAGNQWLNMDTNSSDGRIRIRTANSDNFILATLETNSNKGKISLASTAASNVLVQVDGGALSASGDIDLGGNLQLVGGTSDLTINGNLTVQGTNTDLDVSEFKTTDKIVIFGETNSNGGGIQFGKQGTNDQGARFRYAASLNGGSWEALDGNNDATIINVSASHYFGAAGTGLTGLSSTDSNYEVNERTANATASIGLNVANCGAASFSVRLVSGSSISGGDEVVIKRVDGHTSNTLTILANGTDDIDGEDSIVLESPRAAVALVYNNSGSFKIF